VQQANVWVYRDQQRPAEDQPRLVEETTSMVVINELDWRRGRRMAIDMTAMYDDVIVDVEQIVATGGIADAFTTDTHPLSVDWSSMNRGWSLATRDWS